MKISALLLLSWSALAAAQVTYDNNTGKYVCETPDASYCGGASLQTDIIIRCNNASQGQPGRCSEILAGHRQQDGAPAVCYQTSPTEGDAACAQNCVVYPQDGRDQFTLPPDQCSPVGDEGPTPTPTGEGIGDGPGPRPTNNVTANITAPPHVDPTGPGVVPTAGAAQNGVGALAVAGFAAILFL
ncbi:hypothetical protein SODALDRAFT_325229 [Sodiomyces alkalinus F11]|uniref:Uncharacterized protein n=1 Tax=Sodiomyces alkalinus (strain CBS 110278 / VKM F-3762 / F11) TaxID=1314773 RepID=A0A3N2PTM8_SODAK|nr:hypothetical protein SODALDRAFT_325229 [Sodiomyces alkalinus F11]ROT37676.1 hypothetical protein SODALDRAFT_325229 [Sodiomyces alkalinus F11]